MPLGHHPARLATTGTDVTFQRGRSLIAKLIHSLMLRVKESDDMRTLLYVVLLPLIGVLSTSSATTGLPPLKEHSHAGIQFDSLDACSVGSPTVITWDPVVVECPVCKTKNVFLQWGSYGNYIYLDPSKYQLVFWPHTASPAWYSCKSCRFTTYMEDFKNPPGEKLEALRKLLKEVNLPRQKELPEKESMVNPPYLTISTAERMLVAEKVYRLVLGTSDDQFWSHFFRVLGFRLDNENRGAEAAEARRKSLAITERLLADKNSHPRKELLYIAGAMKHFLRDDAAALKFFQEAKASAYSEQKLNAAEKKNADEYISALIKDYIDMIKKGKGPRDSPTEDH
jgi:hypothetical protein